MSSVNMMCYKLTKREIAQLFLDNWLEIFKDVIYVSEKKAVYYNRFFGRRVGGFTTNDNNCVRWSLNNNNCVRWSLNDNNWFRWSEQNSIVANDNNCVRWSVNETSGSDDQCRILSLPMTTTGSGNQCRILYLPMVAYVITFFCDK